MGKVFLIIKREYLVRVKKRSFLLTTVISPLVIAFIMFASIQVSRHTGKERNIAVFYQDTSFEYDFNKGDNISYFTINDEDNIDSAKAHFDSETYDALLYVPLTHKRTKSVYLYYSDNQPSLAIQQSIKNTIEDQLQNATLREKCGMSTRDVNQLRPNIKINPQNIQNNKKTDAAISTFIGLGLGILIYFVIFMFANMVMRGVIEERTSRIVEIIVSSVKPFQLMMGKIVGIVLVGLTQLMVWIVLLVSIFLVAIPIMSNNDGMADTMEQQQVVSEYADPGIGGLNSTSVDPNQISQITETLSTVVSDYNLVMIIYCFFFFFIFGYLLYSSVFAAIGSAVDDETDSQQFVLPITAPLVLTIVLSNMIINNPSGSVAVWLSMIPFTSPVAMMIRLPFGVPGWQVAISMVLLISTFLLTLFIAAKIYRTGILLYGKKVGYRDFIKWIRAKDNNKF